MVTVELIGLVILILMIYWVVSLIPFVIATIDILKSQKSTKYKLVWLAICLILGAIGVFIYFFIKKKMLGFRFRR